MENDYYRFQLGNFSCVSLYDGYHDYQLEQMVTNASRATVETTLQALGLPTLVITTPFTFLHVSTGEHHILVDMGAGDLLPTSGKLLQSLSHAGIAPQDIDAIFITHGHPDHIGGALDERGAPIFTHAAYYLCKTEWDFWFSATASERASDWMIDFARQKLTPLQSRTILLEREREVLPGVSVLFAPGHTPGHMVVSFESSGERLLYIGDTVSHPLHLSHPDWLPIFDILPEVAAASKQRIFDLAAASRCRVIGQHFPPFPSLGRVTKKGTAWEWQPIGNGKLM